MLYYRVITLFLLIGIGLGAYAPYYDPADAAQHFADFMKKYDRKYENLEEFRLRFKIFKKHLKKLNEWNDHDQHENGGYVITQFADQYGHRSCVDLSKMSNMTKKIQVREEFILNAPDKVDYRDQGLVTEVKNQGNCGSCYIFASIGNIEGVHAKQTSQLVSLSEQQVLDCFNEASCTNGVPLNVMNYVAETGCMAESDYPYVAAKGSCHSDANKIKVNVKQGQSLDTPDVETLKAALVQNGSPLTITLFASAKIESYVGSDVLNPDDCGGQAADHAVLLVGYNTDPSSGKPAHWIVKNSWGTDHGDNGYYYFDVNNQCSFGLSGTCTVT